MISGVHVLALAPHIVFDRKWRLGQPNQGIVDGLGVHGGYAAGKKQKLNLSAGLSA